MNDGFQSSSLGRDTTNFTTTSNLFLDDPFIQYWRFEVVYSFPSGRSSGSIDFVLNQPPVNGLCSINPPNGTTSTLFSMVCSNWFDSDGIKDYSFYSKNIFPFESRSISFVLAWTIDRSKLSLIGFTLMSNAEVRLPAGNGNASIVHLVVRVRDRLGATTESNMSSVVVLPDTATINNLMDSLQSTSTISTNNNPLVELLASGNGNTVGQVISSVSQVLNEVNSQNLDKAVSSIERRL